MDATASREPTWDRACRIQGEMFEATAALGGLDIQLVYYRGFGECKASRWVAMRGAICAGHDARSLRRRRDADRAGARHAMARDRPAQGERAGLRRRRDRGEASTRLCRAGRRARPARRARSSSSTKAATRSRGAPSRQIARLTKGAYCPFDSSSAEHAAGPALRAVATFAAGGRLALEDFARRARRCGAAAHAPDALIDP